MTETQENTLKRHIRIMQAQLSGKQLQIRYIDMCGNYSDWCDLDHEVLKFDWQHNDYRIKEETMISDGAEVVIDQETGVAISNDEDYETEVDEDGRTWYVVKHNNEQNFRKLKVGDAILYRRNDWPKGDNGFMIIDSFDFDSDFAARALYGNGISVRESYSGFGKEISYGPYGDYAPGVYKFSFATEDEIQVFLDTVKNNKSFKDHFKYASDEIKDKYSKYL